MVFYDTLGMQVKLNDSRCGMPTYVKQLFTDSGKEILGQVKWGQKINCKYPGIYVVAITHSAERIICSDDMPVSEKIVQDWIN